MGFQIALNMMIAIIWLFLVGEWNVSSLIVGYLIGLFFVGVCRMLFPQAFYLQKVWAVCILLIIFLKELVMSTIGVARQIIRPKLDMRPGIFAYTTELNSDWEVTLLACLITLTPGTLTLEISSDQRKLYIHAMDIHDVEELSQQIKGTFEKAIIEVTRSC